MPPFPPHLHVWGVVVDSSGGEAVGPLATIKNYHNKGAGMQNTNIMYN